MELKTTPLVLHNIKRKLVFLFILFLIFTSTACATEYIVSPFPSDEFCTTIDGKQGQELEVTVEPYWHFLLWLATMQLLSVIDLLIFPVKLIFAILGFRITEHSKTLDNTKRSAIYDYIKNRPGTYLTEIVEIIGMDRGTIRHHLNTLKTQNKIEAYKDGGKTRYFENNFTYDDEEIKVISALQNLTNKRIISEIQKGKCNTNMDLADKMGVSRATISWYVKNLKEAGLLTETKKGRSVFYKINPSYKTLIDKYG